MSFCGYFVTSLRMFSPEITIEFLDDVFSLYDHLTIAKDTITQLSSTIFVSCYPFPRTRSLSHRCSIQEKDFTIWGYKYVHIHIIFKLSLVPSCTWIRSDVSSRVSHHSGIAQDTTDFPLDDPGAIHDLFSVQRDGRRNEQTDPRSLASDPSTN